MSILGGSHDLAQFLAELRRSRHGFVRIPRAVRLLQLTALAFIFVCCPGSVMIEWNSPAETAFTLALFLGGCLLSAALFQGGLRHSLLGVGVVRQDGRPAGGLRCAWRALLAWLPLLLLLCSGSWVVDLVMQELAPQVADIILVWSSWIMNGVLSGLVLVLGTAALVYPDRSIHDRLAGTRLVPR